MFKNQSGKLFLKIAIGFAIVVVFLALIFFWAERGNSHSTSKFIDEAAELKKNNEAAIANMSAGEVLSVRAADKNDYYWGDLKAKVQLIVYLDYDCPFCLEYYATLKKVRQAFGDKVAIVFRHYPLDSHPNAPLAAQAFECARAQGQAEAMAEKLLTNQKTNNNNQSGLLKAAAELGLKQEEFKTCWQDKAVAEAILTVKNEAKSFGVMGTPTSFLNGRNLPGAFKFEDFSDQTGRSYDGLKTLIQKELEK